MRVRRPGPIACLIVIGALGLGGSALAASFTITTVAGDGSGGFGGDGGPATLASLKDPEGVAVTPGGGFLIADLTNNRIRRVAPDGTIDTVAGDGTAGYNGDGLDATAATLNRPEGVAALPDGGFLIADTANNRIRHVTPDGTISTVAGDGTAGNSGDGGPAEAARARRPRARRFPRSTAAS